MTRIASTRNGIAVCPKRGKIVGVTPLRQRFRMKLFFDRFHPYLAGLLAAVVYLTWFRNLRIGTGELRSLMSNVVTLSGIAIGFLATTMSFLLSFDQTAGIDVLKKANYRGTNYYDLLIHYLFDAINGSFVLALISVIGLFFSLNEKILCHRLIFSAWILSIFWAGASSHRAVRLLVSILKYRRS